mmetsp:Transcript_20414/g.44223  ORF Transcript_20414/g.44223 Transcript_20414/m.44223 type:complete len:371 (-) Transcript_20414:418-1530(-)
MTPSFGLPICIDHSAASLPNNIKVPFPRRRVDGLSHSSQHLQAAQIVFFRGVVPEPHQTANGRRRGVKDRDLVSLHHVPVAAAIGIHGRRLEHQCRNSIQEWPVHNVGVTCNPSCVRNTGVHVFLIRIRIGWSNLLAKSEAVGSSMHCIERISTRRMHQTFRSTRRARGIKNEKRILRIHPFAGTHRPLTRHHIGKPNVHRLAHPLAPIRPLPVEHQHLLHDAHAPFLLDRRIANRLQRQIPPPPTAGARRHDPLRPGIVNPIRDGIGAESREDDRVHRPDARARQHGHGELGDHGHVERDDVALPHPRGLERVGDAAHLRSEFAVGDVLHVGGFVALPDDGGLVSAVEGGLAVAIDGVVAHVELPSGEP